MNLGTYLLETGTIRLKARAKDWKEAVKIGTDLLVRAGSIEEGYYDAILEMTEEYGPYYYMGPGVVMPHSRPEKGVRKSGFALVTLEEPVAFGDPDNDPVDVLLTMAAADAGTQNKEAIVQIATLLDHPGAVARIRSAASAEDLRALFSAVLPS